MQPGDLLKELKPGIYRIAKETGAVIVEVTLKKGNGIFMFSLLADKPGGITVGECTKLNKRIGRFIEEKKPLAGGYSIEVSSPGLDRPLKEAVDFERSEGRIINILLSEPVDGQTFITGSIKHAGKEVVNILDTDNREFTVKYTIIDKAVLRI